MTAPRRILHVVMTIALLLGAVGSVWGTPEQELEEGPTTNDGPATSVPEDILNQQGYRFNLTSQKEHSDIEVHFVPAPTRAEQYVVSVTGVAMPTHGYVVYGDSEAYNLWTGEAIDLASVPSVASVVTDTELRPATGEPDWLAVSYGTGSANGDPDAYPSIGMEPGKRPIVQLRSGNPDSGSSVAVRVVFFLSSSSSVFVADLVSERTFFEGERELFASYPSESFMTKALAFMNRALAVDDGTYNVEFEAAFAQLGYSQADLRLFSDWEPDDWQGEDPAPTFDDLRTRFGRSFVNYFRRESDTYTAEVAGSTEDLELPVVSLAENAADTLYGPTRNVYIWAYLWFLYGRGQPKPLLERNYYDVLYREGINYDYTDYAAIDATGGDELATAAMRYLTWGVEYPTEREGLAELRNPVFHTAFPPTGSETAQSEALNEWITGATTDVAAYSTNYFTGEIEPRATSGIDEVTGDLEENEYFQHLRVGQLQQEIDPVADRITTPFGEGEIGNPLPYTRDGIDTPRTFNYKMYERTRLVASAWLEEPARAVLPFIDDTTEITSAPEGVPSAASLVSMMASPFVGQTAPLSLLGLSNAATRYLNPTLSPIIDFAAVVARLSVLSRLLEGERDPKPFWPGADQGSDYSYLGAAGVGNHELILGSLSMTGLRNALLGADNSSLALNMGWYASMLGDYYDLPLPDPVPQYLDGDGLPIFPNTQTQNTAEPLGLSRADIERSTVIVPEVAAIQPGDLLVRYPHAQLEATAPEPELAMVVGLGWEGGAGPAAGADIRDWWDQIYVVTATPITRTVVLGTWGNGENVLSSVTSSPGEYHVRRLLVGSTPPYGPGSTDVDQWDLMDTRIVSLDMSIDWSADPYIAERNRRNKTNDDDENHWIPNTLVAPGEFEALPADSIRVWGLNAGGVPIDLGVDEPMPISLSTPADPYFDEEYEPGGASAEDSNIHNNRGSGIEVVVEQSDNTWLSVATFVAGADELQGAGTDGDGLYVYLGQLVYRQGDEMRQRFGVRLPFIGEEDGTQIRPGDDYLLSLAIPGADGEPIVSVADEGDFVAVYDKRALWRANLYIDEGEGLADWNNAHPWVYGNQWNRTFDGNELGAVGQGGGGQTIDLTAFPFTPVRSANDALDANNVHVGSVGYDYPIEYRYALDSPFDFVWKLRQQQLLIAASADDEEYQEETGLSEATLAKWQTTSAPDNRWINYVEEPVAGDNTGAPYLQGLGLYQIDPDHDRIESTLADTFPADEYLQALRAGVDCLGFVQRAFTYDGNPYAWEALPRDRGETGGTPEAYTSERSYPRPEDGESTYVTTRDTFTSDPNSLARICVGDIVYYYDPATGSGHIAIVDRWDPELLGIDATSLTEDNAGDALALIGLLESTYDQRTNYVVKDLRTLDTLDSLGKPWVIVRPRTEQ
jgi:hypothetical protein